MATFRIFEGDALETLRAMPDGSFDSCVTDPPYELAFMGKSWDASGVTFKPETWAEVFRVLKDGSRLLAFGGTRTYHRMAVAIEDAGFTIEDCIMWVYGSGFPKHKSKLKPAYEPIVVARKGRASHLNIDECRIDLNGSHKASGGCAGTTPLHGGGIKERAPEDNSVGRWPANIVFDEEAARALDGQSGERKAGGSISSGSHYARMGYGFASGDSTEREHASYGDSGGASRFFYCAKVGREERHTGLENPGPQLQYGTTLRKVENADLKGNTHPTVKPVSLMCWLIKLVTPEGGKVLDPFAGSGSTGIAALREGRNFVGVEREHEYVEIARRRILNDAPMFNQEESAA
jgi:site-specific DNA-methyltransferase (adenine-specific)